LDNPPTDEAPWTDPELNTDDITYFVTAIQDASDEIFEILKRATGAQDIDSIADKLAQSL
jgi:hypothetical protein